MLRHLMSEENYQYGPYLESCLSFAEDSKEWESLPRGFYKSNGFGLWVCSTDGADGYLDLNWCFHLKESEIIEKCLSKWIEEIKFLIQICNDSVWCISFEVNGNFTDEDIDEILCWQKWRTVLIKMMKKQIRKKYTKKSFGRKCLIKGIKYGV